jgi:hypothetical protein
MTLNAEPPQHHSEPPPEHQDGEMLQSTYRPYTRTRVTVERCLFEALQQPNRSDPAPAPEGEV